MIVNEVFVRNELDDHPKEGTGICLQFSNHAQMHLVLKALDLIAIGLWCVLVLCIGHLVVC